MKFVQYWEKNNDDDLNNKVDHLKIYDYINKSFNGELRGLKTENVLKYHIAKMENTEVALSNYKLIRIIYKTKFEFEKNNFVIKKISNVIDQKQMWKEIKDLVFKKNKTVIKNVIFYGIEYKNDEHQISTQFNNY